MSMTAQVQVDIESVIRSFEGELIIFFSLMLRVGFKSPATISQAQATAQYDGSAGSLAAKGRHDPCVVPRAVPIVEAMASIVLME